MGGGGPTLGGGGYRSPRAPALGPAALNPPPPSKVHARPVRSGGLAREAVVKFGASSWSRPCDFPPVTMVGLVADGYDSIVFDCDGVLWSGNTAVPRAASTLRRLRAMGKRLFFVTNNSSKSRHVCLDCPHLPPCPPCHCHFSMLWGMLLVVEVAGVREVREWLRGRRGEVCCHVLCAAAVTLAPLPSFVDLSQGPSSWTSSRPWAWENVWHLKISSRPPSPRNSGFRTSRTRCDQPPMPLRC